MEKKWKTIQPANINNNKDCVVMIICVKIAFTAKHNSRNKESHEWCTTKVQEL